MLERKKKEKNAQEASSESTLVDECSAEQSVIKKSPGKLKDIRKKWEQQATESHRSSPRAATERQEDASHLKVRKTLNLWEHRLSENSPSNGGSPRSPLAIQILDTNSVQDPSFRDKKIKRDHFATTQQRAPPKRNELRDAFISLAFAFFMIGIAMLIHQPYGPLFEKGAFGTFPSADSIVIKFNEIGEYTKNGTNYVQEWMQQWKVTISNVLETWSSNGTEATKSPSAPSDVRHFLLL